MKPVLYRLVSVTPAIVRNLSSAPLLCCAIALTSGCGGSKAPADAPSDPVGPSLEEASDEAEVTPSSVEVKRASELIKEQKFDEAAEILKKETAAAPGDPQAAFFYGVALEALGQAAQAEQEYRRAIKLDPKLIESSQNLSALLLSLEKNEEALKVTEVALEHAPKDPALLGNRAIAMDMLGRPEAVGAYKELLEVSPGDQANRFNYAVVLFMNQKPEEAKTQLGLIKSSDMDLLSDVEKLYVEMKDFGGCVRAWDRVIAQASSAEALAHRARCELMAGDKVKAESDLKSALAAEPKSAIAHFYYGKLLQKEGKKAEAKTHFQAAIDSDPNGGFGKAAKAEL